MRYGFHSINGKSSDELNVFYLLLPLENDMRVPKFLLSCRIVVENVKSGERFIKFIARFKDRVGVERFRACPSVCDWKENEPKIIIEYKLAN